MKKIKSRRKNKSTLLKELMKGTMDMNYKDLKRNCVVRGMPFEKVIDGSFPRLQIWLHHNMHQEIITERLDEFDDYVDAALLSRGKEELVHPQLRLGYIGERDEEGKTTKTKRVKGIKKKRVKREKTKDGIFQGTKKAYTFECQQKGYSLPKTIRKTFARFPDASEKSIKIWYKKSARIGGKK